MRPYTPMLGATRFRRRRACFGAKNFRSNVTVNVYVRFCRYSLRILGTLKRTAYMVIIMINQKTYSGASDQSLISQVTTAITMTKATNTENCGNVRYSGSRLKLDRPLGIARETV